MRAPFVDVLHLRIGQSELDLLLEVERLGRASAGSTRSGVARVALREGLEVLRQRLRAGE